MGRYEDLTAKRDSQGLTDEEANELGELIAKRDGKPYGNAQNPPPAVQEELEDRPEAATKHELDT